MATADINGVRVSALPVATAIASTDTLMLVQGGVSKKGTVGTLGLIITPATVNSFGGGAGNTTNSSGGATGFGQACLINAATANDCAAFGSYSLRYFTGGVGNTAVGSYSLEKTITGANNTAVGDSALRECLTFGSTAMGYVALGIVTTGEFNNGFGRGVLGSLVSGSRNCAFGNEVLAFATGSDNVAMGHNALYNLTTGGNNVVVGSKAGLLHQLGSNNVFIGDEVAGVTGQGVDITNSIVIGRRAVTAFNNSIVIGTATHTRSEIFGGFHSHGALNVATNQLMGKDSGYSCTGANNSTYGVAAAFTLSTGYDNVAMGWQAFYAATSAYRSVAIGTSALQNGNATAATAVGYAAGISTTGIFNTYVGYGCGQTITSGTSNTFMGNSAGTNASQLATATNSMALGDSAFTTASNQVVLGSSGITETVLRGNLTLTDAYGLVCGTGTGTKFATATTQKIGFWNTTPIVQPTTAVAASTIVGGAGTTVKEDHTFDGYTVAKVVKALRNAGLLA